MRSVSPSRFSCAERGAALVLVLCFVVLITGLAVAYLSRTLVSRQLSNASASAAQAGNVADSAVDILIGDLKQEIVNGSATPAPAVGNGSLYTPTQAGYAVPQRIAVPAATAAGGPIPNLVRRSARADTVSGSPALTSRASAASSTASSANGRVVSLAGWNRHYLIPTATASDPTPVTDFTAPDWVFVTAEKGPCVLSAPSKDANGSAVTVTGRYAYAVYDEGGLLDINHTGFPSASTLAHIGAKPAPSYADLTQLGLTAAQVDSLLGWRQYATLQATGAFPNLQPSGSQADAAYYRLFLSNPASLLQVPLTVWNGKTDQSFLSRQQLVSYFAASGLDPKYLQYFGTFNRSLNQPSHAPEQTRPVVLDPSVGGNDAVGNLGINPSFLAARVTVAFTRPDKTAALVGEPLVKKRFPLNRLAWVTYQGPSANRNQSDADMAALLANGITSDFLKQGTSENVELCFGLRWDPATKWTYVHGSSGSNGAILNVSNPAKTVDVARLNPGREPDFFELLKASINPGSIAKSSLSPTVLVPPSTGAGAQTRAAQAQYGVDISLDTAILQIGANIIDQFDTDGFPTQLTYNLGGGGPSSTLYGDENLPYVSRVRAGLIRVVAADPSETDSGSNGLPIKNTGVGALMNYPEVWNPHAWSSSNLAQSFGVIGPHNFQVYAETSKVNGVAQATNIFAWNTSSHNSSDADSSPARSPGFQSLYGFSFGTPGSSPPLGGEPRILTKNNTLLTFSIDATAAGGTLFREPTILFTPGVPSGSNLAAPSLVPGNTGPAGLGNLANNASFFGASGGLLSAVTGGSDQIGPKQNVPYLGFYIGAHPLRWADATASVTNPPNTAVYQSWYGGVNSVNDVTYVLACEDGSGGTITYDKKSVTTSGGPDASLNTGVDAGFGLTGSTTTDPGVSVQDYGVRYYVTVDPRTSRFGMLDPWISSNGNSIPPRRSYSAVNSTQGTIKTDREGAHAGTAFFFFPFTGYPYNATDWYAATMGWYHDANVSGHNWFRPGLLAQNNPAVISDAVVTTVGVLPEGTNSIGETFPPFYYADADGVVRRASGGNVPGDSSGPANTTVGLPTAYALGTVDPAYSSGRTARQMDSRPVILNRPFRSVAELGYVYSGTPWKNLDLSMPESGGAALLDVFCVNDDSDASAMTAGRVNLNTRQIPVLQAILAQANKDIWNDAAPAAIPANSTIQGTPASTQAQVLAQLLVKRTALGPASGPNANQPQPLQNISDLVGRWVRQVNVPVASGSNASATTSAGIDGLASCDGFTADLANLTASTDPTKPPDPTHNIQRFGEGAVRALANAGQTRIWNLMFDIVAQTGRYPAQATTLDGFNVEGEQHCWVHMAIDRCTGQVIDKQVEIVTE